MPRPNTTVILKAIQFAACKHEKQRRKDVGESPYINHPIAVAYILADVGGVTDVDALVSAVLHDTIEDTNTTPAELEQQFGQSVLRVVEEKTDDKTLDKEVRKQLQIELAPRLSALAKAIKLADKICNVRDVIDCPPVGWSIQRRKDYLDWTEMVVLGCRGTNESLERCYDQLLSAGKNTLEGTPGPKI
ncbi:MAG TPA: HD domain-containing protein [Candidatus Saccharimonadales bacterium]|nr:HD domain-containing protein [Candidatus Saccharimonadales bacterium]